MVSHIQSFFYWCSIILVLVFSPIWNILVLIFLFTRRFFFFLNHTIFPEVGFLSKYLSLQSLDNYRIRVVTFHILFGHQDLLSCKWFIRSLSNFSFGLFSFFLQVWNGSLSIIDIHPIFVTNIATGIVFTTLYDNFNVFYYIYRIK